MYMKTIVCGYLGVCLKGKPRSTQSFQFRHQTDTESPGSLGRGGELPRRRGARWAAGPGRLQGLDLRLRREAGPVPFVARVFCPCVFVAFWWLFFFFEGGESLFPFLVLPVWPSFSGPNKVTAFLICGFGQRRFPFLVHRSQTVSLLFPGTWSETGEDSARLHLGGPGGGGGGQKGNLFQKREYLSPPAPFASIVELHRAYQKSRVILAGTQGDSQVPSEPLELFGGSS